MAKTYNIEKLTMDNAHELHRKVVRSVRGNDVTITVEFMDGTCLQFPKRAELWKPVDANFSLDAPLDMV